MIRQNTKLLKRVILRISLLAFSVLCILSISGGSASATNSPYGAGAYGECQYGYEGSTCSITISNNGFILDLFITPTQAGSCTIQSDQVSVATYDPAGYTLTLGDQTTNTKLVNGSYNIATDGGSPASPATLADDWGYRVDSLSGFGSGPTSPVTNSGLSSLGFAGIESSGNPADTIASTSSYNGSPVTTTIWYGVCLDYGVAIPTGLYSSTVIYTATAN